MNHPTELSPKDGPDEEPEEVPEELARAFPPEEIVRPAISVLHRDPPLTAKHFFYHRKLVFAGTLTVSFGLAFLAAWKGGEVLLRVDEPVARWVAGIRTDELTQLFNDLSHLGDNIVIFSAAGLLAVWRATGNARMRFVGGRAADGLCRPIGVPPDGGWPGQDGVWSGVWPLQGSDRD